MNKLFKDIEEFNKMNNMFKETKEGTTHHNKDACYKCDKCGAHYFIEQDKVDCEQRHLDYFSIQQ